MIDAYRRFCFLAWGSGVEITPSQEVDAVWHLHLTFSRDYWDVWCADVLRARLRPRRLWRALTLGIAFGQLPYSAQALPVTPLDWPASRFLALYVLLLVLALALGAAWIWREALCNDAAAADADGLDPMSLGYVEGGPTQAFDTAALTLLQRGVRRCCCLWSWGLPRPSSARAATSRSADCCCY